MSVRESSAAGSLERRIETFSKALAIVALMVVFVWDVTHSVRHSDRITGYEKLEIAQNLANGNGFSFHESRGWLFDPGVGEGYRATAWVAPVYPATLGLLIWAFGDESGELAMLLVHALLFLATGLLVFMLARTLHGPLAGPAATLIYLLVLVYQRLKVPTLESVHSLLSNGPLGGLVIVASALCLVKLIQKPTSAMSLATGVVLGLSALSYASTIAFAPTEG